MEKDNAGKATTEFDNSVTSEEQSSLTEEKNENKEDVDPSKEVIPTEETPGTPEVKEDLPEENASADKVITESKKTDEPVESKATKEVEAADEITVTDPAAVEEEKPETLIEPKEEKAVEPAVEDTVAEVSEPEAVKEEETKEAPVIEVEEKEVDLSGSGNSAEESKEKIEKAPEATPSEQAEGQKEEEKNDDFDGVDFSEYSIEELVEVVKKLGKDDNPYRADKVLKVIAPLFNKLRSDEKAAALEKFLAEGGTSDEFQFIPDELSLRFDANYKLIKDKKTKKFKEQESQRTQNLVLAEELLEELREFVDSDESSASFNNFKEIQKKWKDLGDVPAQQSRTLWANYNALLHRFYDQRSIYFELKELDKKKNYELKVKICEKAEELEKEENLRDAIRGLNDLHHDFKHLGPVPQELQEELWQRFKAASDKIYERRKSFVHELKEELHENQIKKEELIEKISVFKEYNSDRIKEWNEKTKEVLALQKAWEAIGGLPKDKAKAINRDFWTAFKQFFKNKHLFFKKLDADRDQNLVKKQELLAKAIELKDSEEWDKTSNELKNIQNQWREIGPVPEKMRKKLYDEFKGACDHFFERRRSGYKSSQDQYKVNLKKKKEIIAQIVTLVDKADDSLDKFNELRKKFEELGYVPKKNIQSIKTEFHEAIGKFLNNLTVLNEKEKTEISLSSEFSGLANSEHSQAELYQKEQSVRRQISKYEDDIALWENNLEFFAQSKSTDKLRLEVNKKIDDARIQVDGLKRQLKMLRSL